jgi:hypothetical protein
MAFIRINTISGTAVLVTTLAVVALLFAAAWATAQTPQPESIFLDEVGATIEYRAQDKRVADRVAEICLESVPEIAAGLGLREVSPFRVFLIPDLEEYGRRMNVKFPAWGVAFAFMESQVMLVDVKRASNAWNTLEKVIPHELSHILVAQRVGNIRMPVWFLEGLAQWQAHQWSIVESWRLMEAVWGNRAPYIGRIADGLPAEESSVREAYRVSYAAFQHRFDKQMDLVPEFLDEVAARGEFDQAFESFWGETQFDYYVRFSDHLVSKYRSGLMLFQTGPLFTLVAVLFVFVIFARWLRNRRRLREMEESERGL